MKRHAFRLRLLSGALLVVVVAVGLLAKAGLDGINRSMEVGLDLQTKQISPLLDAALGTLLAQRDYAGIDQLLSDAAATKGIDYLILTDAQGRTITTARDPSRPPPPVATGSTAVKPFESQREIVIPIGLAGQALGTLRYGISLVQFQEARARLIRDTVAAAAASLLLAVAMTSLLAFGLTRRLARLGAVSQRLAAGELSARVREDGSDEIGQLNSAFDAMAATLEARLRELNESEETLDYAARGSADIIWDWDLARDRYFLSPRFCESLGYTEQELAATRASFLAHLHPSDRPLLDDHVRRHFEQRTPYDIEYRLRRKDGTYLWFRGRGQAVWDADGTVMRFSGASTNITAQKIAEENIRALLAEKQALLDNVLVGIVFVEKRIIRTCNRRFEEMFGYDEGSMVGEPTEILYPTRDAYVANGVRTQAALSMGDIYTTELQLKRKDGSHFWASQTGRAIDASDPRGGSVWFYMDVSERRAAMDALRESEQRFRKLFEESADASLIIEGTRFVDFNRAAMDMLRITSKEKLANTHPSQLSPEFQPDGRSSVEKADEMIARAFRLGSHRFEWMHRRADGEVFPVEVLLTRIDHRDQHLLYVVWRDITDRKRAEAEIRELTAGLEQRVHERTMELTSANHELEAFSYSVSHDLTAPLRGIDGFSRMLEEDYDALIDERGRHYIQRIRGGTQRMQQLIDDMLSLSRITRNEMVRTRVDLSALAGQILAELGARDPQRSVETRVSAGLEVDGDANLLRIALENLIGNAWKFTARRDSARIEVGFLPEDAKRVYFVKDNGAGFDMKYAGKLFGAFQRMHGANDFAGTGIGLAIVSRIVRRHGGKIWADAAVDQGASFYFTLQ